METLSAHSSIQEQGSVYLQARLLGMAALGVERVFFALGMTTFITFIGWMGIVELAVSNVILNLLLVAILPAMGFGIAASTLVARSLGAQRIDEIQIWQKNVTLWALAILCSIALLFILYPRWICSQFLQDPMAINMGVEVVQFMVFFLPFEALHMVMYQSLLGIGSHHFVMKVTFCLQWFISLPLVYLVGPYLEWGILATWGIHFGIRVIMFLVYRQRWESQMKNLKLNHQANLKQAMI
jgi:multidrug resistance protein, MATE family